MEAKFTPGPWFADDSGNVWRRDPAELYQNGGGVAGDKPIAVARRGWTEEGEIGFPAKDNALLIAAAPELFEALQDLLGPEYDPRIGWLGAAKTSPNHFRCEHCGAEDLDCTKQPHKPDCRVIKARAALAKATGEQS